jgi:hypothetical protein
MDEIDNNESNDIDLNLKKAYIELSNVNKQQMQKNLNFKKKSTSYVKKEN